MSGQVASHTRGFPDDQGAIVTPSGRFPLQRDRPVGSKRAGTWAEERALQTMSFKTECLGCLPSLHLQLRPCLPRGLTRTLQWRQEWGLQMGVPIRRPTAIRSVSSSIRRPADEIGRAFSQAPDSLQEAANKRALSSSS